MSNYITVEKGVIKRILPNKPINVEFGSTKGYVYSSTMEAQPDSEFEDIEYPGKGGTVFYVQLKNPIPYDGNPLSKFVEDYFENLPDEVERVEYMTPQEILDKGIITEEQYINLVNNK